MCILIATKDRLELLSELLKHIANSTALPGQIVIVYNGTDVLKEVNKFSKALNIQIIKSEIANQSIQKYIGIQAIAHNFEWVLFLDDDLILDTTSLEYLMENYAENVSFSKFAGFGLNIVNDPNRNYNYLTKHLLSKLTLYSFKPGAITKSGHPQTYMDQEIDTEVDWLNGTSLWKSRFLNLYVPINSRMPYAAYEDVCFSYKVKKHGKLLFVAKAVAYHQKIARNKVLTADQFISAGYLRYYFATINGFSKRWLLFSQIFRSIDFMFQCQSILEFTIRVKLAKKLFFVLLSLSRRSIHGDKIWDENLLILS